MTRRYDRYGEQLWTAICLTDEILVGASACYEAWGVRGTSLRDVAARSGVAPATVRARFPTTQALAEKTFRELARERFDWWPPRGDARTIFRDLFRLWMMVEGLYVATLADVAAYPAVRTLHTHFDRCANVAVTHAFVGVGAEDHTSASELEVPLHLAQVRAIVRLPGWYAWRNAGLDDEAIVALALKLATPCAAA